MFDFNGWSEDKPIGKVDTVESHLEHIDHYFQAKHVFEDVLNLTSTPTDPIVKSICRPELIQVGADVLANVRLGIVYSYNIVFHNHNDYFQKETMAHSNAGVYLGTFLVLVVLIIGGVVLILLLRFNMVFFLFHKFNTASV